jgi:DNA ligase 1
MNKTLYQLDRTGTNVKVWTITVTDKGSYSAIEVQSGRFGGNLISNTALVNEGKNIGKSNETTHFTQACAEAQSKIDLKLREGYVPDMADAKASTVLGSGIPQPMLAMKHCPDGSQTSSKTLSQIGILGKEIVIQPKLDGNRCLIVVTDGEPKMYTRKGDLMPVQLTHILNDVKSKLGDLKNIILDGELFSSEISFNTLNGLIKRVKATDEEIQNRLKIKFNLYDTILDKGYEFRMTVLPRFASDNILIVPSTKIIATDESIKVNLEKFLAEGHEGLMIRQLGIGYENKRTWQLCKVKVFEDEEFLLVGLEEDVRGGFVGTFVLKMQDGTTFRAGASGQSVEERTEMWKNKEAHLNKMATVEFFGRSEYNVPRFPKFKGLR